ncbi:MAG: cupin domain-containing protein [Gemmatimonadaceae bacterium]
MSDGFQIDIASAIAALPAAPAEQYNIVYRHGTFEAGLYAPRGVDDQTPHTRDEAYVVVRGSGHFVCGDARTPFAPGALLFVRAGTTHCFEDFSEDLTVWVMFYGPQGGESPGRID